MPAIPIALSYATVAQVSIPIAVLLWGIILPVRLLSEFVHEILIDERSNR